MISRKFFKMVYCTNIISINLLNHTLYTLIFLNIKFFNTYLKIKYLFNN